MKNSVKIFTLALVFFGLTAAKAAKKIEVTVSEGQSVVTISLVGVSAGESLVVKGYKGASVYKKVFTKVMNFEKAISLKGVKNGVYFVEVEDSERLDITPVLKNDLGVTLIKKAVKTFIKPQFKNENGHVTFTLSNPKAYAIDIIISSEAYVLSKEEGVKALEINRTFDTSKLPSGSYSISIKNGTKTFSEEFKVF